MWLYGFGMLQGAASVADSFTIFFAAAILSTSVAYASSVDALGNLGFTLGAAITVFLIRRFTQQKALMVFFMGSVALSLFLLSAVSNLAIFLALVFVFEVLWAPVGSLAPSIAIHDLDKSRWGAALSRLNEFGALGGVAGLAFAGLWMAVAQNAGQATEGAHTLFIALGSVVLLSAFLVHYSLSISKAPGYRAHSVADGQADASNSSGVRPHLMSDQLLWYYILSFLLFVGVGMSFSGVLIYMVRDLRLPIAAAIVAVFAFKLAVYLTSRVTAKGIGLVVPLQVQSLAVLGRSLLVVLLALLSFALPSALAFPSVLAIVSLWGALSAILSVTGLLVAANLAPSQRRDEGMSIYIAITNGATILGALIAGGLGVGLGFQPMFLIAAALAAGAAALLLRI